MEAVSTDTTEVRIAENREFSVGVYASGAGLLIGSLAATAALIKLRRQSGAPEGTPLPSSAVEPVECAQISML
jgi:hypothetical protein